MNGSKIRFLIAMGMAGAVGLAACGGGVSYEKIEPAALTEVDGAEDLWMVELTADAAERLDIQTTQVEASGDGYVVPSAAVFVDPVGKYYVYTNPEHLRYVRAELSSVVEEDQQAFFAEGPAPGTEVVVVGVPELYGTEFGIGK